MENCRFKTFNYKYGCYVPCEILAKLGDNVWKVREYATEKDGSITVIETATFTKFIENL